MIEKALRTGQGDCTTKDELLAGLLTGDYFMWVVHEGDSIIAALILSAKQYANKSTLYVELAAGRALDEWVGEIEELLREFSELRGIDTIEASCRRGLARKLAGRGWKTKAVIMELMDERRKRVT